MLPRVRLAADDAVADGYALAHAAVCLLGADADEGVVVLAAAVAVAAAARDACQILVVQTAQGLLRQLELLGLVHHRPPRLCRNRNYSRFPVLSRPAQVGVVINNPLRLTWGPMTLIMDEPDRITELECVYRGSG